MAMTSKKLLLLPLFSFFILSYTSSQPVTPTIQPKILTDTIPVTDTADGNIFEKVEIEASFAGGENAWRSFLERNLNAAVPVDNGAPGGTYTVVIQFVVDKEGKISDVKPLTAHGFGMETEVMRVIKRGPRWSPAVQEGRFVKAYRKQPVTFMVTVEKKKNKNKNN
ncbi:MAG: energy transducer TonB [Ferruginibacter sp.]|nr:energy transducer TonB [Chitinophagaceae bacterium]